jgi:hypothetical protein
MNRAKAGLRHARQFLGVIARDLVSYNRALAAGSDRYLSIRNRAEQLEPAPEGPGFDCAWQWTSELHAPKFIPSLGLRLMRRALDDHPIERSVEAPQTQAPQVTFLIGHRGTSRLPHLLVTLEGIAAQRGAGIECIVIEQDHVSQLAGRLPSWVRLLHTPTPSAGMPYCRSWAFNVGARIARGNVLVFHDNDMLVPSDYAAQIARRAASGWEVVNLKRFVFYLSQEHTAEVLAGRSALTDAPPSVIVQNLEGGGSVAITREAFERIGGFDESFVGWGGEDNEFWERAQSLRCWRWGSLPIVHLWHEPQPGKRGASNPTEQLQRQLSAIDVRIRIETLRNTRQGDPSGPAAPRHLIESNFRRSAC